MANGNPFTIDVGPGFGRELLGLGQALGGAAQTVQRQRALDMQQQELQEKRALEAYTRQQALQAQSEFIGAMESGDPDRMQATAIKWADVAPGATKFMFGLAEARSVEMAKQADDMLGASITAANTAVNAESAIAALEADKDKLEGMGLNTSVNRIDMLIDDIRENPDNFRTITGMGLAAYAPDRYEVTKDKRAERELELKRYEQGPGETGSVFDKLTGNYKISPALQDELDQKLENDKALGFKDVKSLNADVSKITKNTVTIRGAATALEAIRKTNSSSDQLAAVFKFMKSLDPDSVVREGEQAQARTTGGLADRMVVYVNKLLEGAVLSPKVFDNMIHTAKVLANQAIDDTTTEVTKYLDPYGDLVSEKLRKQMLNRVPKRFDVKEKVEDLPEGVPLTTTKNTLAPEETPTTPEEIPTVDEIPPQTGTTPANIEALLDKYGGL